MAGIEIPMASFSPRLSPEDDLEDGEGDDDDEESFGVFGVFEVVVAVLVGFGDEALVVKPAPV